MDYSGAVSHILTLIDHERTPHEQGVRTRVRYDLGRFRAFIDLLGRPHEGTPAVHIAGSKGKGSTAAMCASILQRQGGPIGLFTSPHLHNFRERISVDGVPIPEEEFSSLVDRLWDPLEAISADPCNGKVTLFELLTAMGFVHFGERKTCFNVLEVGLGGRLDTTNVVTPAVSVITSISLDHTSVLGDTLELIAGEKAGIIKPGVPVVTSPQVEPVLQVIRSVCRDKGSQLVHVGKDVTWEEGYLDFAEGGRAPLGQRFRVQGRDGDYSLWIPLLGDYQLENAAVVVAAMEMLREQGHQVSPQAIETGIAEVSWPCRMEVLSAEGPLVIADGAHNPYSASRLRSALPQYFKFDRVLLVLGVSQDKNLEGIVGELAEMKPLVIASKSRHPRAVAPEAMTKAFHARGVEVQEVPDSSEALRAALAQAGDGDLVLATGSLFMAAEIREIIKGITPELYPELGVV